MRRAAGVMAVLALAVPILGMPIPGMPILGMPILGTGRALAQDSRPEFSVDETRLPPRLVVQPKTERDRQSLIAAGVGALVGIVAVDAVAGGLLLAPLGLPSFAGLTGGAAAGAAAAAAPTYSLAQELLAGVATMAAAFGGGYLGLRAAGPVATP